MTANFSNLKIERIIIQEAPNKAKVTDESPLIASVALSNLGEKGTASLKGRLVSALGGASHSVEVDIADFSSMSAFQAMTEALDANDATFAQISMALATRLVAVQNNPSVKDGILVLIQGTCDEGSLRFILAMKAESDEGFARGASAEGIVLQFIEQLVLTAKQKLYKVGCFVEPKIGSGDQGARLPVDYYAVVFDHLINKRGEGSAAEYFYSSFMGCSLKKTAKQETTHFYENAAAEIEKLPATAEQKFNYHTGLNAYMRSPQSVLSTKKFQEDHIDPEFHNGFTKGMKAAGVSSRNITKDTTGIADRIKTRRLRFGGGIKLSGPSEAIKDRVTVDVGKESVTLTILGSIKNES